MLNVGIIGIGNAGNQVAVVGLNKYSIPAIAINSSEKDLETVQDSVTRILIGDHRGAGKDRRDAKKFLKERITNMMQSEEIQKFMARDIIFIISSTGGGTGSGIVPILSEILKQSFPDVMIVVVGILPTIIEALSTQANTLEYLEELYSADLKQTYMMYDNDRFSKLPTHEMMRKINESIVDDINVLRGTYQTPTPFSSIDEKDASKIIGTPDRLIVASVKDIKEKDLDDTTIDEMLIKEFKQNAHAEMQRDGRIHRIGVISNLNERLNSSFNSHLPKLQEFIGMPVEEFEHISINDDPHIQNNVFVVVSGLSKINDRIRRIKERIEEINSKQNEVNEEENELKNIDIRSLNAKRKAPDPVETKNDIKSLFDKYGI